MRVHLRDRQRGAALITVMFLFSFAAIVIYALLARQRSDIERTASFMDLVQAYEYAMAGEELARQVLFIDDAVTYEGQEWARLRKDFLAEYGILYINISDLQGRFNINNLIGGATAPAFYLRQLLILRGMGESLVPAIIGRMQKVAEADSWGADNITLLRDVEGMSAGGYDALAPFITALPERASLLNVNTAPTNLLKIYVPDETVYERFTKIRSANGFLSEAQLRAIGMNTAGMAVESHYFQVRVRVRVNGETTSLTSIIRRDRDKNGKIYVQVISRSRERAF